MYELEAWGAAAGGAPGADPIGGADPITGAACVLKLGGGGRAGASRVFPVFQFI